MLTIVQLRNIETQADWDKISVLTKKQLRRAQIITTFLNAREIGATQRWHKHNNAKYLQAQTIRDLLKVL